MRGPLRVSVGVSLGVSLRVPNLRDPNLRVVVVETVGDVFGSTHHHHAFLSTGGGVFAHP